MSTKAKQPTNPWRTVAIAACVIALCALVVAGVAAYAASDANTAATTAQAAAIKAQHAIDQLVTQRVEARRNTCLKDKKFADAHNGLILYLASVPPDKNDTRAPQRRAALIRDFEMKNLVPTPDCSPAGIAAFYSGQGGTKVPEVPAEPPTTTTTTAKAKKRTTTARPPTSTTRPTATTATTVKPPTTTTTACAGPTIPVRGIPCL